MRNPFIILIALLLSVFFTGVTNAAPKQRNYEYEVLALSTNPFYLNGKRIVKGDKITGKTILALNNTQAIRLRQIRKDGKRVVFTIGPKSVKRNETINGVFKRKFTSSKDKPIDWKQAFNDTLYLIDSLSLLVNVAPDSYLEISSFDRKTDTIKVLPQGNELIITNMMFEAIGRSNEEKYKVVVRRNDETILISDNMYIIFMQLND